MSRIVTVILIYHRYKPTNLIPPWNVFHRRHDSLCDCLCVTMVIQLFEVSHSGPTLSQGCWGICLRTQNLRNAEMKFLMSVATRRRKK
jgi:hypothetical protein